MKATPFSVEPYYPMLLSNGQDGILIDYSGSNFCSKSGHTHPEQIMGAATGWYKASSRIFGSECISQIIRAGYQVILYDVPCEPDSYEQWLDAKEGILHTNLVFQKKLHVSVESFLSDEGLWGEKITVTDCPDDWSVNLAFRITSPISSYRNLELEKTPHFTANKEPYGFNFSYEIENAKGLGALLTEQNFEKTEIIFNDHGNNFQCDVVYENLKVGSVVSRILFCSDTTEYEDTEKAFNYNFELAKQGFDTIKEQHTAKYVSRTNHVNVTLPNEKLQQIYDTSRYVIQGSRNRKSGALLLGIQPHLWGGGIYCSYDAYFDIMALMTSGDKDVINGITKFFDAQSDIGENALKKAGFSGIAFTGWTDCFGNFGYEGFELADWFTKEKPLFICNEIINRYTVWKYANQKTDERLAYILKQVYIFFKNHLLRKINGKYCLIDVKAGNEAGISVEADTFTVIALSKALFAIADMLNDKTIHTIGKEVLESISQNYTSDGILLPFKDAPYLAGLQLDFYLYMLPQGIPFISVEKALENGKTAWGYDFGQSHEVYRHWPWISSRAAICYTHEGRHAEAMQFIKSLTVGSTSLGALPEKIRIDGMPINYWYTSAHALAVWAIHDAFAHTHGNELRLCYGMNDEWQNFCCEGICMENGITVSLAVENGTLKSLKLCNNSEKTLEISIKVNKCFSSAIPQICTLEPNKEYIF